MDPITIPLKHPVEFGQRTVSEFVIKRRLKGKDFRGVRMGSDGSFDMGAFMDLAASLVEEPPSLIDALDAEDLMEVIDVVSGFMPGPGGRRTGGTASGF